MTGSSYRNRTIENRGVIPARIKYGVNSGGNPDSVPAQAGNQLYI